MRATPSPLALRSLSSLVDERLAAARIGAIGLLLLATNSCSAILGIQDPIVDGGATDGTLADAGHDAVSKPEASPGADSAVDAAPEASCSSTVDTAKGFFVSTSGTDGAGCGAIATPCKTVDFTVKAAGAAQKTTVYVAPGTYFETVHLAAGVTVQGGFAVAGSSWTPLCNAQRASAVQIQAPPGAGETLVADALGGTATVRDLTVTSAAASTLAPGQSVYGVVARGATTTVVLDDVDITLVAGVKGLDGDAGAPGPVTTGGCSAGDGADGDAGPTGPGSDGGTVLDAAFVPGDGVVGSVGVNGHPGTDGGAGSCSSACQNECGMACPPQFKLACAGEGFSGCGGQGGAGGLPGHGGGSSIAVFVWGATVQVTSGALTPGNGGAGGAGGPGGPGADGDLGSVGDAGVCVTGCPGTPTCSVTASTKLDGGSPGGKGGKGGQGGTGGGGAGGWTCGYFQGGGAMVTVDSTTLVTPGQPGLGGTPQGAAGIAKPGCP